MTHPVVPLSIAVSKREEKSFAIFPTSWKVCTIGKKMNSPDEQKQKMNIPDERKKKKKKEYSAPEIFIFSVLIT